VLQRLSRRIARSLEVAAAPGQQASPDARAVAADLAALARKASDVEELLRQLLYNLPAPTAPGGVGALLPSLRLPWFGSTFSARPAPQTIKGPPPALPPPRSSGRGIRVEG
jgi:hypothetical protein